MPQNFTERETKGLRDLIYEPEHQEGGVCWCGVAYSRESDGKVHIRHKEQRDVLSDWLKNHDSRLKGEIADRVRQLGARGAEDVTLELGENKIFHADGWNDCLRKVLTIIRGV